MLNYIIFLLKEYQELPFRMINARNVMLNKDDSAEFIINLILDTELKSYIIRISDHKLSKYPNLSIDEDILRLDSLIGNFKDIVFLPELRRIIDTHFNPIWRVAAFFCAFIVKADEVYRSEHQ